MNVVDSSAWLEYFADSPAAVPFSPAIEDPHQLVVPVITLFEVFKRVLQQREEASALEAIAVMQQGNVIAVDSALAVSAARLSVLHRLPLADAIIYATARMYAAIVWTQDEHFRDLPGVRFFPKPIPTG
ncbi:MAG TPA: type II toxin-antitoxin system VapC family toxin [Verrucomicrobiota bacterium]|nr:type II toxin-antitoxin system VapC family toxin [Verrucomicrobiota bacterium]HNU49896.1 type II toxin-antitoxin system VapC family toxin [Verrucomicrobiota bacterium]